ncbi:MAG: DUF4402 domain-containing protein [Sphingomonas sp.]|nr:DUF4402 domain-containing protein [Sphingomonas sp.]
MTRAFFFTVAATLLAAPAAAQRKRAPEVEPGVALSFGVIAAGGRAGEVRVSPDGALDCAGPQCLGGARAGDFYVTGVKDFAVAISATPTVLRNARGATLRVRFTPSTTTLVLRPGRRQNRFTMGGTLSLAADQPAGDYVGEYLVVLDYL